MALFQQSVLHKYLLGIHKQQVDEAEWIEYFNRQKAQADDLKSQIAQRDSEIDGMVYGLYGLGEEEIGVVENSSK